MEKGYTKGMYVAAIKKLLANQGYDIPIIAKYTYDVYVKNMTQIDRKLTDNLLNIACMENGPQFEKTKREFIDYLNRM